MRAGHSSRSFKVLVGHVRLSEQRIWAEKGTVDKQPSLSNLSVGMQKQKVTVAGSVLAAIAASSCCIGPLIALVLGVGGAAATSGMEKWRPVFLGVTFVLLGVSWYVTYRKPAAHGCGEGAACAGRRTAKG